MTGLPFSIETLRECQKLLNDVTKQECIAVSMNDRTYKRFKDGLVPNTEVVAELFGWPIFVLPLLPDDQIRFYEDKEQLSIDRIKYGPNAAVFGYGAKSNDDTT